MKNNGWKRASRLLIRFTLCLGIVALVLVNVIAYNHASKLSHFEKEGITVDQIAAMNVSQKIELALVGIPVERPANYIEPGEWEFDSSWVEGERGGLELWRLRSNQLQPDHIVLFPGYTRTKSNLLNEALAYQEMGLEVWLVDFAGSGGSEGNVCTGGYEEAKDVRDVVHHVGAVMRAEQNGSGRLLLHGNSMGSAAILRAMHDMHVSPDGLILESPFPNMRSALAHRLEFAGVPDFPLADLVNFWGGVQHGYAAWNFQPSTYAQAVRCPVLHLAGSDDPFLPMRETWEVFNGFESGDKVLSVISSDQHQELCNANPGEWDHSVRSFLQRHQWGRTNALALH